MRDMETCRAEIFRRSGERIRRRQRRRRMALTLCAPLALCLAIWTAVGTGRMGSANKAPVNDTLPYGEARLPEQADRVTVTPLYGGESWTVEGEAAEVLKRLLGGTETALNSATDKQSGRDVNTDFCTAEPEDPAEEPGADNALCNAPGETAVRDAACRITLPEGGGDYLLAGETLTEETTGEAVVLTEEDLAALRSALGLEK